MHLSLEVGVFLAYKNRVSERMQQMVCLRYTKAHVQSVLASQSNLEQLNRDLFPPPPVNFLRAPIESPLLPEK